MEDFNNKRRNGTFVYAADYRDPVDFEYYFDQMSAEVGSAELSLREVMDELYSLIADISRSCPNPMTEPFELPDDNHYEYDRQHKKETINAYHKELIIIYYNIIWLEPSAASRGFRPSRAKATMRGATG